MVDLFTDDLDSLKNDQLFSAIKEFSEAQPCEGYRHDFKLKWNNDGALQSVAAFANTFGGLLFIGVKKQRTDTHATLVGVESDIELKTGIASSIATNITPTPSYNIS